LHAQAQVEGIATNGTDIWLVDAKQDSVYKYAGAASRLSGSQNAAGSFGLNTSNKDPKGIVTDGSSLWVVNDSSTDKVFKYTVAGGLLGSWTVTGGGGSPTGITLDPTNVGHLWVVDIASDRVHQYDNAAARTSGSQAASASFLLAAGNSNPQDIADPPAGAAAVEPVPAPNLARVADEQLPPTLGPSWHRSLLEDAFGPPVSARVPAAEPKADESAISIAWTQSMESADGSSAHGPDDGSAGDLLSIEGLTIETSPTGRRR
jgi:hypothetical protein